jgi:hypothetical protein
MMTALWEAGCNDKLAEVRSLYKVLTNHIDILTAQA